MKLVLLFFLVLGSAARAAEPGGPFLTDVAKAQAQAKKQQKPMLIDFYGIWCPPCNELDETVFETAPFLKKAAQFTLLRVDADAETSWKIKDRYKVGGYPTIVFTNPSGEEVYRVVGYRNLAEFLRAMDMVLAAKGKPVERSCNSKNPDDLWRCAIVCSERKENGCAEKAFAKLSAQLPAGSPRILYARGWAADTAANADLKRSAYEGLLKEFPKSALAPFWAQAYYGLFEDNAAKETKPKKELIEAVVAAYPEIRNDPARAELGILDTDLAQVRAELLSRLGKDAEAKAAWKEAATMLDVEATKLPAGAPARGFTIERTYCLEQAGETEAALKLAEEYRAKYPNEFTFHFRTASLLKRAKRYADAIPVAKKAYEVSYGDNRIRAAMLLVELYATVPDKAAAKEVRDAVAGSIKPDAKLEVRTHRYLKQLDQTMKKSFGT